MIRHGDHVDAKFQYRFGFGDLVCYHVDKENRTWKFDTRNEVGFYVGDKKGVKGAVWVYRPYKHDILLRDDVHHVPVSDVQLLQWYGRREAVRQAGLPFQVVRDAYLNLLPNQQFEEIDSQMTHETATEEGKVADLQDEGNKVQPNPNDRIILPVETQAPPNGVQTRSKSNPGPRRVWDSTRPRKANSATEQSPKANATRARRNSTQQPYKHECNTNTSPADILSKAMEDVTIADDYTEAEARILTTYRMLSLSDPDMPTPDDEVVDTRKALSGPQRDLFMQAVRTEWENLCKDTLKPVTNDEIDAYVRTGGSPEIIGLTMKTKRKLKPDGTLDKFKGRGAGRGDQYIRQRIKKGKPLPKTFSPTVKPLTFAWILQLAVSKRMKRATMDIKQAYLNVPYPEDADWIVVRLERHIAEALGLDPSNLYRVMRYIYGLPESGRAFYEFYKSKLLEEGYTMSEMDPCLFYRIQKDEVTYIVLFVDDTYVFSNDEAHIKSLEDRMKKHFDVTIEPEADAFLGINFHYDESGNCKLSQKKLLTKLFNENPPLPQGKRWKPPKHPYGPAPSHGHQPSEEDLQAVDITVYLRLLGLLMYLTKSRPEITTAVSFGATNAHNPLQHHYRDLQYIVEYLRANPDDGLIIRVPTSSRV